MHKRGPCRRAVSVRPSVCLSRLCTLSKRINISSKLFHPEYPYVHSSFSIPNIMAILRRKPPHGGVESRWDTGVWKNAIFDRYLAASWVVNAATVSCYQHGAARREKFVTLVAGSSKRRSLLMAGDDDEVCMTRSLNVTPRTTKRHLIVRNDKSILKPK